MMVLQEVGERFGQDWFGSVLGHVARSCKRGKERPYSIKYGEFLD